MNRLDTVKIYGLALGASLLCFVVGLTLPLVGVFCLPLVPYPFLYLGLRHRQKKARWLPFVAVSVVYVGAGLEVALGYLTFALLSVFLFAAFGRSWSLARVVLSTTLSTLAVLATGMVALAGSFSSLWRSAHETVESHLLMSLQVYESMGLSGGAVDFIRDQSSQITTSFLQIVPSLVFLILVFAVLANLTLLSYQFGEYRSYFFSAGRLIEWRSPERMVWLFVGSGFLLFLPLAWGWRAMSLNLFLFCALFYFFHGLAIVAYFFHHRKVPMFLRVIGYVLIVLEQFLTIFVIGLGLFDLWGDFRRLKGRNLDATGVS